MTRLVSLWRHYGSGGLICMDEDNCYGSMFARFFMDSSRRILRKMCSCRVGTKRMLEFWNGSPGERRPGDIECWKNWESPSKTALCGLGQTAPNPVLSTIRFFRKEYEDHILRGKCESGVCADLFISPCQNACPAGVNVPGYVALIAAGKIRDAYHLIRKENPFPTVCGRVCTHPCESRCRRGSLDEPIAIMDLKRYASDYVMKSKEPVSEPALPANGKSIGIVGAGPSGLTCAYYLAKLGYGVSVYESKSTAGGMLA